MERPAFELLNVHRRSDGYEVLAGVDLRVEAGERVALVGAARAGKSTLVRALLDLCAIDSGSIRLEGQPHTGQSVRARLAYLPEQFQPPFYLRGRGFIDYMLALYGVRPADAPIGDVCTPLGLDGEALAQPVQSYSQSTARLLALAACLLSRRPLLVLDEPMTGLEPGARERLRAVLRAHQDGRASMLFTAATVSDAEGLAHRIAVLHGGRIVAAGSPQALVERAETSDLIGAIQRLAGERIAIAH